MGRVEAQKRGGGGGRRRNFLHMSIRIYDNDKQKRKKVTNQNTHVVPELQVGLLKENNHYQSKYIMTIDNGQPWSIEF